MPDTGVRPERPDNLHDLCTVIWALERDLDLLNRSVEGVHFWPLIRFEVFLRLTKALGFYRDAHPVWQGRSWWRHLEDGLHLIRDLRFSPWNVSGPRPTVVLPHPRKQTRDGSVIDIYSHRVVREALRDGVLVLDPPGQDGRYLMPADDHVRRTGVLRGIAKARALRHWPGIKRALREDYSTVSGALRSHTGSELPVSLDWLALRTALFREQRVLYHSVFRRVNAERLFVVVAYILPEAVAAANDLGIPVSELQHGSISPYHLGYNYPGRPDVPYTPDRFLVFGRYWAECVELPGNTTASVVGSDNVPYCQSIRAHRPSRRVVVLSQGTIGEKLFGIALGAARVAPDWEFVFRLHPSERKSEYSTRMTEPDSSLPNFRLSGPEDDFYALLSSAEVQLGVFSTGLFEGMRNGVRTILVPLPGIEHMTGVLEKGDAVLARTPAEVANYLVSAPTASDPDIYYAAPVPSLGAALS